MLCNTFIYAQRDSMPTVDSCIVRISLLKTAYAHCTFASVWWAARSSSTYSSTFFRTEYLGLVKESCVLQLHSFTQLQLYNVCLLCMHTVHVLVLARASWHPIDIVHNVHLFRSFGFTSPSCLFPFATSIPCDRTAIVISENKN